jgi:enoyl-CoA hydratase
MSELISWSHKDGVAHVVLHTRTMSPLFFDRFDQTFSEIEKSEDLRVALITSDQKAFSYGLDLQAAFKEHGKILMGAGLAGPRTELLNLIRRWQRAFDRMASLPVPVITAIQGWCIGGGLDLISAADIRIASEDAMFSLREAAIAIVADLGSLQRLPSIIGDGQTRHLAFTAEDVTAERALAMGLVTEVYPSHEALHEAASAMARNIASHAPLTIQGVKRVLNFGRGHRSQDGLDYVAAWNSAFLSSEDLAEALSAFMSKRKPEFKGR